jgi:hypothetical protein
MKRLTTATVIMLLIGLCSVHIAEAHWELECIGTSLYERWYEYGGPTGTIRLVQENAPECGWAPPREPASVHFDCHMPEDVESAYRSPQSGWLMLIAFLGDDDLAGWDTGYHRRVEEGEFTDDYEEQFELHLPPWGTTLVAALFVPDSGPLLLIPSQEGERNGILAGQEKAQNLLWNDAVPYPWWPGHAEMFLNGED